MKTNKWIAALCLSVSISLVAFTLPTEAAKKYAVVQEETSRSFVPIRYVGETFGYKVGWDPAVQKVTIANNTFNMELTLNSTKSIVNGTEKTLDAAPFTLLGTTYVPLRFVTEQFGMQINPIEKNKVKMQSETKETIVETVPLKRFQQAIDKPVVTNYKKMTVNGKAINVNIVHIDLYHPTIDIDAYYANNKVGSIEPFKSMVEKSKAKVAVNGTFFNAYSETDEQIPYGFIVKDGEIVHNSTEQRAVFVYTKDADVKVLNIDDFKQYLKDDVVETAIQAGPLLVKNSKVVVDPVAEGFRDPKILTNRGARSAIGVTNDNKLIIVTTNGASIPELADLMKQLNSNEAMNLDGGASSALYASGKYITPAGRQLSNIITIHY